MTKAVPKKIKQDSGLTFPEELMYLIRKGRTHGFVTHKEILQAYSEPENDLEMIDAFLRYLGQIGVEIRDAKPLLEIPAVDDGKKKTTKKKKIITIFPESISIFL